MVTSSVRMVYWVHCNTTNLRPAVSLDTILVISITSLQHRFVDSASTSNNSNHSTRVGWDNLFGSRWEFDSGSSVISIVTDNSGVVSRTTSECSTITKFGFNIANNGTFREGDKRQDISYCELGLLSTVNKLSSVHSLSGNEKFLLVLVFVGMSEKDSSKRCSTSWIMDNLFDDTLDVSMSLSKI
jgi:hypothetical protein